MKTAIVTGASGMDGSYMCELLLGRGYKVFGFVRREFDSKNIEGFKGHENFQLMTMDLSNRRYLPRIFKDYPGIELIFHTAGMTDPSRSFKQPIETMIINYTLASNILEAIRTCSPTTKFINFSTDNIYNDGELERPLSPYAISKLAVQNLCHMHREKYGIYAMSAILSNHTSKRRSGDFVERKIADWLFKNQKVLQPSSEIEFSDEKQFIVDGEVFDKLALGNLDVVRDFSHSSDIVEGVFLSSQHDLAEDVRISTGHSTSIGGILDIMFGKFKKDPENYVYVDPNLVRAGERGLITYDSQSFKELTGWAPSVSLIDTLLELVEDIIIFSEVPDVNENLTGDKDGEEKKESKKDGEDPSKKLPFDRKDSAIKRKRRRAKGRRPR